MWNECSIPNFQMERDPKFWILSFNTCNDKLGNFSYFPTHLIDIASWSPYSEINHVTLIENSPRRLEKFIWMYHMMITRVSKFYHHTYVMYRRTGMLLANLMYHPPSEKSRFYSKSQTGLFVLVAKDWGPVIVFCRNISYQVKHYG